MKYIGGHRTKKEKDQIIKLRLIAILIRLTVIEISGTMNARELDHSPWESIELYGPGTKGELKSTICRSKIKAYGKEYGLRARENAYSRTLRW